MPEGDTIHRLAAAIRPDLVDHELVRAQLREQGALRALEHSRVVEVDARGKHLLIGVDGGWSLRTHLGMYGDVHRYRSGQRWKRPPEAAVLVLETEAEVELAWFEPAQAELWPTKMVLAHPQISPLGPDLLGAEVDFAEVVRRASGCAAVRGPRFTIGELLLDQSVACGVGNIYKNELLFIEGIDPWAPALAIDDETLERIFRRARRLLQSNLGQGRRSTRTFNPGEPRLWVYGRQGRPCLRCGSAIGKSHQGAGARVTFRCPRCQPAWGDRYGA